MKTLIAAFLVLSVQSTFAQDMSRTEAYEDAYQSMPDGSEKYIGKCKTHQDYAARLFKVVKVIHSYQEGFTAQNVKKIIAKIGETPFVMMSKEFFGFDDAKTNAELIAAFVAYADDLTIEKIKLKNDENIELIRFNVGYGGGNGAYMVILKTPQGKYKTMSIVNDGSLDFCDKRVWKTEKK